MSDHAVVAVQIGRQPRSPVRVVHRCHLELPVVTDVPPLLDDGTPFPTRYWLSCPLAVRRIGRVEAAGGVRRAEEWMASDPEVAARHERASARYAGERDALLPPDATGPRPSGGVGGARAGVKCLHAHYADYAAGNDNPAGEWVAPSVEPLDCEVPCVVVGDGGAAHSNPEWREPAR